MPVRSIRAILKAEDSATAQIAKVAGAVTGLAAAILSAQAASLALRETISQFGNASNEASKFEKAMSNVAAVSGATGKSFDALSSKARQLGRDTVFTALEAADALAEFSRAGFNVREAVDAVGPSLNLAAAGQLDVATAANIAAKTLNNFRIDASEAERVMDVITKTATSSAQTVEEFGQAMKFAAQGAGVIGLPLEETAIAFKALADLGADIASSGRGIRGAFLRLLPAIRGTGLEIEGLNIQIDAGSDGILQLTDILDGLTEAGITARNITTVFENAQAGLIAKLLENRDVVEEARQALEDFGGTTQRIADRQLDNFFGSVELLSGAFNDLQIAIGQKLNRVLRVFVDELFEPFAQQLADGAENSKQLALAMVRMGIAAANSGTALSEFLLLTAITARALPGVGAAVDALGEHFKNVEIVVDNLSETFKILDTVGALDIIAGQAGPLGGMLLNIGRGFRSAREELEKLQKELEGDGVEDAPDTIRHISDELDVAARRFLKLNDAVQLWVEEGLEIASAQIQTMRVDGIEPMADSLDRALREVGVEGAIELGDTLVDSAADANISFKRFFVSLLRDLARAILRATILQRIISSIGLFGGGGGSQATAPASAGPPAGFSGSLSFQHGGIVPTGTFGNSPVMAQVHPGEAVLPRELTDMLLTAARQGAGGGSIINIFAMDGNDVERVLTRHPAAVGAGVANARRRGELD